MCFISTRDFLGLPDAVMVSGYGKPLFIASCRFAGNHPEGKCGPCGVMLTCSLCFWSICRNNGMLNDIRNSDMYMYLVVSNDHDGNLMLCFSMLFWGNCHVHQINGSCNRIVWFVTGHEPWCFWEISYMVPCILTYLKGFFHRILCGTCAEHLLKKIPKKWRL